MTAYQSKPEKYLECYKEAVKVFLKYLMKLDGGRNVLMEAGVGEGMVLGSVIKMLPEGLNFSKILQEALISKIMA